MKQVSEVRAALGGQKHVPLFIPRVEPSHFEAMNIPLRKSDWNQDPFLKNIEGWFSLFVFDEAGNLVQVFSKLLVKFLDDFRILFWVI